MELLQRLGFERDTLFASGLALPVLADPSFPTLAGCGIASRECHSGNLGIRYGDFLRRILRDQPHDRVCECRSLAAIEDVTFDAGSILAREAHIAAIIEGLLKRVPQI